MTESSVFGCGLHYYLEDHHRLEGHSAASESEAFLYLSSHWCNPPPSSMERNWKLSKTNLSGHVVFLLGFRAVQGLVEITEPIVLCGRWPAQWI